MNLTTTTQAAKLLGCPHHIVLYCCQAGHVHAVKRARPGTTREIWYTDTDDLRVYLAYKQPKTVPVDTPIVVTVARAAEILALAVSTILTYLRKGKLAGFKTWLYSSDNQRHEKWLISTESLRECINIPRARDCAPAPWSPVIESSETGQLTYLQYQVIVTESHWHILADLQPGTAGVIHTSWDDGESFTIFPNGETDAHEYQAVELDLPPDLSALLTMREAMETTGLSYHVIRKAVKQGTLLAHKAKRPGLHGKVRVTWTIAARDLRRWAKDNL